jgi:glutathione S-transferase
LQVARDPRAIARCIAQESNSSLAPSAADLRAVAPFEQTAPVKSTQFDVPAGELVGQRMFALLFGREPFEERVKALDEALQVDLEDYERILSKTKYIGGDVLTLLNLFHLPFDELLVPAGFTWLQHEKRFPNVVRCAPWFALV